MIRLAKTLFLALLFIVGITFSMENTDGVVLKYYFGLETTPIPVYLLVLFSVFFGILLVGIAFVVDQRSLKRAVREKEREIALLDQELKSFREQRRAPAEMRAREPI